MKESIVAKRAFQFGLDIIKITRFLPKTFENVILIKQIIRSATSIGANIEEALGTNSQKDFAHCMNIAKKEARETRYWLRLLIELNPTKKVILTELLNENIELINMLTKIVKTTNAKS